MGRAVFADKCASCHGGAKWTKSQIFHRDNPAAIAQNMAALDPGVTRLAPAPPSAAAPANEFFSFTCNALTIKYLEDVGTFNVTNPLELRDNAAASTAFGVNGFNVPSLLSINYHAPYLHRGQAQTLEDVFPLHKLDGGTIANLTAVDQANLLAFLKSIDGTTAHIRSDGDDFRDMVRLQGASDAAASTALARLKQRRRRTRRPTLTHTGISTGPAIKGWPCLLCRQLSHCHTLISLQGAPLHLSLRSLGLGFSFDRAGGDHRSTPLENFSRVT